MASSTRIIDGAETIIFTSRSRSDTITLKAEPGKSLVLDGSGGGGTSSLTTTKTTTTLGYYEPDSSSYTNLLGADSNLANQGTDISFASSDNRFIMVGSVSVGSHNALGSIFNNNGSSWVEEFLVSTATATSSYTVATCDINETGDAACMTFFQTDFITFLPTYRGEFYTRSGTTWSYSGDIYNLTSVKLSGDRAVGVQDTGSIAAYANTGSYGSEQTLYTPPSATSAITNFDISAYGGVGGSLIVYALTTPPATYISINTRSGSTWTEIDRKYLRPSDIGISALACQDGLVIAVTNQNVYVWDLTNTYLSIFDAPGAPNSAISRVVIADDLSRFALYATHHTYLYAQDTSTAAYGFNFVLALTHSNDATIGMNANFFGVGNPTNNRAEVAPIITYTPLANVIVQDVSVSNDLTITSKYKVKVVGDLEVTGNMLCSGIIDGSLSAVYCEYFNTQVWLDASSLHYDEIVTATDTALQLFEGKVGSAGLPISNTEQITIVTPGVYLVSATVLFKANDTGYREVAIFRSAGAEVGLQTRVNAVTGSVATKVNLNGTIRCAAGDSFKVHVVQNSGGDLLVACLRFSMTKVGA